MQNIRLGKQGILPVSAKFGGKQRRLIGPCARAHSYMYMHMHMHMTQYFYLASVPFLQILFDLGALYNFA